MPTAGRPALLRECLASLGRCRPHAAEVVVVDQSGGDEVASVVEQFEAIGARVVTSRERGVASARNVGLRSSSNDVVVMTDDDCTVAESWVATGWRLVAEDPERIVTGRVLASGDPALVPSVRDDPDRHDHTGELLCGALYTNNAALGRKAVIDFGGFDERFDEAAEDNDLCYRWLRSGRRLLYEPEFVVWHHDWRSPDQMRELHARYWRARGAFYAKHLRRRDIAVTRFLLRDLRGVAGVFARSVVGQRPEPDDPRGSLARGLASGFARGWRKFARVA